MIDVYKILNNKYDSRVNLYLEQPQNTRSRGHDLKLVNHRCRYDLRKYSYMIHVQVANTWNSLPVSVIFADTTDDLRTS